MYKSHSIAGQAWQHGAGLMGRPQTKAQAVVSLRLTAHSEIR